MAAKVPVPDVGAKVSTMFKLPDSPDVAVLFAIAENQKPNPTVEDGLLTNLSDAPLADPPAELGVVAPIATLLFDPKIIDALDG
jgi:hypothetical protein